MNALGDSIRKPLAALPGKEEDGAGVTDDELRFIMDINLTEALLSRAPSVRTCSRDARAR